MSGTGRWGLAAVGAFVVLAVGTLVAWDISDRNPVTGDEPHYLVMADSLVADRSLEVTDAYQREFRDAAIYEPGLAPAGAEPDRVNAHAIDGSRGVYSVHSYGLPAVIAVPFAIGGVMLAKLAMIAFAAVGGWIVWRMSARYTDSEAQRAMATGVVLAAMSFVTASTQIYPDLPAGVLALVGLAAIQRLESGDGPEHRHSLHPAVIVAALGVMPWLHIKTAATAVLLAVVVVALDWRQRRETRRLVLSLAPLAIAGVALIAYNSWAFGRATGPYSDGALQVGGMPLTVLLGLYVDQFQGMFVQNPALLVALVALVPFVRRFPVTGVVVVITHFSFVVPNAMHENWYGGFSFAGRFGVAGALVIAPVAVFGISRVLARRTSIVPLALVGGVAAYHGVQFVRYGLLGRDLYNDLRVLPDVYPSQVPVLRGRLPMLYQAEWALGFAPNLAALVACAVVVGVGLWCAASRPLRPFGAAGLATAAAIMLLGAVVASDPKAVIRTPGRALEVANGERRGDVVVATGDGGIVTFGPYVRVGAGRHAFRVRYRADADPTLDDEVAGDWVLRAVGVDDALANGALVGSDLELEAGVEFDVPVELAGRQFEIQTATPADVELDVIEVTIRAVDSPDG